MRKSRLGISRDTVYEVNRKRGTDDVAKTVGKRMQLYRLKLEITQTQFAERYSVSKNTVSHYEMGAVIPPLNIIFDVCDGLNMTLDEFFGFEEPEELTVEEEVLLKLFESATPEAREVILETARTIANAFPLSKEIQEENTED